MKKFPYKEVRNRYMVIAWLFALAGVFIIVKASYTMFAEKSKWEDIAKTLEIDSVTLPVNRGDILSCDSQLLATYVPEYKIYMDYTIYERDSAKHKRLQEEKDTTFLKKLDSICIGLNKILPKRSIAEFKQVLMEGFEKKSKNWLIYPERVSYLDYNEIKKLPFFNRSSNFSGFHVIEYGKIDKPYGSLAARTLGDVQPSTGEGTSGLQLQFDSLLRGRPGLAHKVKVRNAFVPIIDREPIQGANVHTTLDINMQDFCENALMAKLQEINGMYGVVVLMDVPTGDIKAMANLERGSDGVYRDQRNYAVGQMMQPGSVFKTVSITAGLESGKININQLVDCSSGKITIGGHTIKDASIKSAQVCTVQQVLGFSSNVGVIKLITQGYGSTIAGQQQFCDDVMKLGIGDNMDLDIPPSRVKAYIPSPQKLGEYWSASSMGSMSIGYSTMVPPISLLAFYNGLANGGRMMRPRLVTHITREGQTIESYPPRALRDSMCSAKTVREITSCLEWVVSGGLGSKAGSPFFKVAGKTGTARVQEKGHMGEYLITFVGFFPADNPKYSCIVCMRKQGGGSGGGMCGPVFKQVAEYVMAQGDINTISGNKDTAHPLSPYLDFTNLSYANRLLSKLNYSAPEYPGNKKGMPTFGKIDTNGKNAQNTVKKIDAKIMPDLIGMGPRDACYLLEKMHLRVKLNGTGKVIAQSLPYGSEIKANQVVVLTLGVKGKAMTCVVEPPADPNAAQQTSNPDSLKKQTPQPVAATTQQ